MDVDARRKLSYAILLAAERFPCFASGFFHMIREEVKGLNTMGSTRKWRLLYDPAAIHRWSPSQKKANGQVDYDAPVNVEKVAGVVTHELMHLLREHEKRRDAYGARSQPRRWNQAADFSINPTILDAGMQLPEEGLFPDKFGLERGLTAEAYYELIPDIPGLNTPEAGDLIISVTAGHCGSCAGNPMPGEEGDDAEGRSTSEIEIVLREVASAVKNYKPDHSRRQGTLPAGWDVWADAILAPPQVDWRTQMRAFVRNVWAVATGQTDYHYAKPSRRQGALGFGLGVPILAATYHPIPHIVIWVDTSGSMGLAEGQACLAEIEGLLRRFRAHYTVMSADAAVHETKHGVTRLPEVKKILKGGGGTDFRPAFEAIRKMKPRPHAWIGLTDGMGLAPESAPPGVKGYWVIVGKGNAAPVSWGKIINIDSVSVGKAV